ncbi:potassium efflux system protein [Sporosarcina luteola]|nr:potassium efflux system protein [Sporosarcina luteola]
MVMLTIPVDLSFLKEISLREMMFFFGCLALIFLVKWVILFVLNRFSSVWITQHVAPLIRSLLNWISFYGTILLFLFTFSKKKWLFTPFYESKGVGISLFLIIVVFLVITFASRLARAFTTHIMPYFYDEFQIGSGMRYTFDRLIYYTMMVVALVISFRMVGLSIGKFGLLFSALGIGVGFGIRNVAANFVSGIIILFERPIEVGEFVEIEGKVGRIQTIKLRSTDVIVDKEGTLVVPNQYFIEQIIKSRSGSTIMADVKLEVKYGVDNERIADLLIKTMKEKVIPMDGVLPAPEPNVRYTKLDSDHLDLLVEVPVVDLEAKLDIENKMRQIIAKLIYEHGMELKESEETEKTSNPRWKPDT